MQSLINSKWAQICLKRKWCFVFFCGALGLGYFAGEIHFHNALSFEYGKVKNFFKEAKVFAEVIYFVMASFLIPFAYVQYRSEKRKERKKSVEHAHKLFRYYTENILVLDKKYDTKTLNALSSKEEIQEFNDLLNKLDTFAATFIHGIADSESGKVLMGTAYCMQIQNYLPTIKRISRKNYREGLENLFELEQKWKDYDG